MDAVLILAVFLIWVIVGFIVMGKAPGWFAREGPFSKRLWIAGLAGLVYFIGPFLDEFWGRFRTSQLCAAEGGVKVFRSVHNVEGLRADGFASGLVSSKSYKFAETANGSFFKGRYIKGPVRYSLDVNGALMVEEGISPKARFAYQMRAENIGGHITRSNKSIVELPSGEVLGQEVRFSFPGGWVLRYIGAGYGGALGTGCSFPAAPFPDFLFTVLKPSR